MEQVQGSPSFECTFTTLEDDTLQYNVEVYIGSEMIMEITPSLSNFTDEENATAIFEVDASFILASEEGYNYKQGVSQCQLPAWVEHINLLLLDIFIWVWLKL